ncbi:MAG: DNA-directed RNA polymerase subunit beta', partial [Acidobacteriota bacterium]
PLVPLEGGRFATSDLNDLYRRVINRNNRLKKLLDLRAPDVIVRNEKRMLQEAIDALMDNGRRGRVLKSTHNRPLKSLSDALKGKQGRFRQNLLGKRVDYSGRSVIVVGPELKLHQCGLPKKMALELFKPFIYNKLEERGIVSTIKAAKEMVELERPEVWDILEEVIQDHPVLLNRAPTLHRLGIQAFEPMLIEGKAIQIHPLVCTAFNADFDGDQMAVHVPLSTRAQTEAHILMMSSRNLLKPASGKPIVVPTQDMVLGIYFLTKSKRGRTGEGRIFAAEEEVLIAYENGQIELNTPIKLRWSEPLMDLTTLYDDQDVARCPIQDAQPNRIIDTTVGRVIFNQAVPSGIPFINGLLKKKGMSDMVDFVATRYGHDKTVEMVDSLKNLGFRYSTRAGVSIGIDDMVIPAEKERLVEDARQQQIEVEQQYRDGAITGGERYNKVVAIWSDVTDRVAEAMFKKMKNIDEDPNQEFNPIYIMADSGARGSKQQMRQLAGMRGLMAKPSGEIIETPITANFREGLTVAQYFISTHGARKGLADTALKTADSGYLTRRLVDVAQDVIITHEDCATIDGITARAIVEGGEVIESLRDRLVGRVALDPVYDPTSGELIVDRDQLIGEDLAETIQQAGIESVNIRSGLTCEITRGLCRLCYGRDLSTGRMVEIGQAVGVIAAESIGEPGTQLTMRTFHIGGTASQVHEQSFAEAKNEGTIKFLTVQTVKNRTSDSVVMNRQGNLVVLDRKGRELERHAVAYGAILRVEDGQYVEPGTRLIEWDPYTFAILTEETGTVHLQDVIEGVTVREEQDDVTGFVQKKIISSKDEKLAPKIIIRKGKEKLREYQLPVKALVMVEEGEDVVSGDTLAKIPRESTKTKDITGGLPRVVELFEAREPKEPAVISEIDGQVEYGQIEKGSRIIHVYPLNEKGGRDEHGKRDYKIPKGKHVSVREGEIVQAGDALMDGPKNPHDILKVLGESALQNYLVNEIQEVYRLQGVEINDKHIEVVVRQMMRWVHIEDVGDTEFVLEEKIDKFRFRDENQKVIANGGAPAMGRPLLLGITKASLTTDSFISAASFQETTRVLTEAAIRGAYDALRGLKENVIMGRLIPAGTGAEAYRDYDLPMPAMQEAAPEEDFLRVESGADESHLAQLLAGGLGLGPELPKPKS